MAQIHVITGATRRRGWSEEQKRVLVAAAFAPGAVVSAVARRADVYPGQLYRWRQELSGGARGFAEVIVAPAVPGAADPGMPAIEIALSGDARVRIAASAPPELAAAVVRALVRR